MGENENRHNVIVLKVNNYFWEKYLYVILIWDRWNSSIVFIFFMRAHTFLFQTEILSYNFHTYKSISKREVNNIFYNL